MNAKKMAAMASISLIAPSAIAEKICPIFDDVVVVELWVDKRVSKKGVSWIKKVERKHNV